jgi:hypothetical protein
MPQIPVENLSKIFRVPVKAPGLRRAATYLHRPNFEFRKTVDPIGVFIESGESAAYYPTLRLLDKMSPPPLLGRHSPRAGLGGIRVGRKGMEALPDLLPGDRILTIKRSAI